MRILVASNLYPPHYIGGYELRCRDIVEGLKERGHKVFVLTSNYGVGRSVVEKNIYRWLPVFIYEYTRIPSDGILRQFIKAKRAISKIGRLIKKHDIELVYISKVQGFQEPVITRMANMGIPVVWDISDQWLTTFGEGPWYSFWKRKPAHKSYTWFKAAAKIIVSRIVPVEVNQMGFHRACYTSRFLRDYHTRLGIQVHSAKVIHCGCPSEFISRDEKAAPTAPFRFIYSGQLVEGKGVHTIIQAAAHLRKQMPELAFTIDIIGDGIPEYVEYLKKLTKENALNNIVNYMLKLPRNRMPKIYRKYDGLIMSAIWDEAFTLTILEAMASGVPVISTATGGNCEIINDGDIGLEFEPGNCLQLAYKMKRMMTEKGLWNKLRERGREIVSGNFMSSQMVDSVEDYIEESINILKSKNEYSSISARNATTDTANC